MTQTVSIKDSIPQSAQALADVVLSLLRQQPGAEAALRGLVQPTRCGGGLSPDLLCDLALQVVAAHGPVSSLSDWAFEILGKQLGVGFFFALLIAASNHSDAAGCKRCLRVLCDRARFRWRPFQAYRRVAKQRGLCLRTLRPLLPRTENAPAHDEDQTMSARCPGKDKDNGSGISSTSRDWRQRRPLWSRLACQGAVDELLDLAAQDAKRSGQPLNSMDLAFLLRAARRNGTAPQLARALHLVPPDQQAADGVLLQEVLCALRRLRQPTSAWLLVDQAQRIGLRLNCLHYTTLLAMCGDHEDHAGVLRILSDMHQQGVVRDALFSATLARLQASR